MQKNLIKLLFAGMILLLGGCQSNSGPRIFNPFPMNPSYSSYPPNQSGTLVQSVQDALIRTQDPVIGQVHVETSQNVVTLTGYVKKIRQSDLAEQITRQVPGVQNVQNHLIVRQ
jgi:hyperosmotically inducible protein